MTGKIYYVAHAQDSFLKPLTPELFDLFTTSNDNQAKIQAFRRGADKDKSKNLVHLFYFQGVKHEENKLSPLRYVVQEKELSLCRNTLQ